MDRQEYLEMVDNHVEAIASGLDISKQEARDFYEWGLDHGWEEYDLVERWIDLKTRHLHRMQDVHEVYNDNSKSTDNE